MGCEYGRTSEPLCKRCTRSPLNELLFLFVIVAFLYVFVTQFRPETRNVNEFRECHKKKKEPVPDFNCDTFGGTLHFMMHTKTKHLFTQ